MIIAYNLQWYANNDGTLNEFTPPLNYVAGANIDMENAWDITTGDNSITVAVLDSGVNFNHPELAGRFLE